MNTSGPRPTRTHSALGKACGAPIFLSAPSSLPAAEREWVRAMLPLACKRLSDFSFRLRLPTEIRLYATTQDFRRATQKHAEWLRAWAGYRVVHLLPPSLWRNDSREIRAARLTHELSHVALFQSFSSEAAAKEKSIPVWFLEGAASVCAKQGSRRMPVALVCRRSGDQNPLVEPALWRRDHHLLYGAAHAAVAALVGQQGQDVVSKVIKSHASKVPVPFEQTLKSVTGQDASGLWKTICPVEDDNTQGR